MAVNGHGIASVARAASELAPASAKSALQLRYELLSHQLDRIEGWARAAQLDSNVRLQRELTKLRRAHRGLEPRVNACQGGLPSSPVHADLELERMLLDIAHGAKRVWAKLLHRH